MANEMLFKLSYQLPAVECVKQIDVTWLAVEYLDREILAILHKYS